MRLDKNSYYLNIAKEVLGRSTCIRKKYGAIIVNRDETVSTGYNGSPNGCINCSDVNTCKRQILNVPSGERYELCRSIHAEENAVISAARKDMIGATLYLFGYDCEKDEMIMNPEPCILCKKHILRAGIKEVIVVSGLIGDNTYQIKVTDTKEYIDIINNMQL